MSDSAVDQVLRRIVETALSPEDLEHRVSRTLGAEMIPAARRLAGDIRGVRWLHDLRTPPHADPKRRLAWLRNISSTSELRSVPIEASSRGVTSRGVPYAMGMTVGIAISKPSIVVLLCGCAAVAALLVFPPFIVPWNNGVQNAGFAFILTPPSLGESFIAIVNAPLLATLIAGVALVTGGLYVVARRVEGRSRHLRGPAPFSEADL